VRPLERRRWRLPRAGLHLSFMGFTSALRMKHSPRIEASSYRGQYRSEGSPLSLDGKDQFRSSVEPRRRWADQWRGEAAANCRGDCAAFWFLRACTVSRELRDSMVGLVQTRVGVPGACRKDGRIGKVIAPWTQR
jgi:hypothetical protein